MTSATSATRSTTPAVAANNSQSGATLNTTVTYNVTTPIVAKPKQGVTTPGETPNTRATTTPAPTPNNNWSLNLRDLSINALRNVAKMIPGVDDIVDAVNVVISLIKKDYTNAATSAADIFIDGTSTIRTLCDIGKKTTKLHCSL